MEVTYYELDYDVGCDCCVEVYDGGILTEGEVHLIQGVWDSL